MIATLDPRYRQLLSPLLLAEANDPTWETTRHHGVIDREFRRITSPDGCEDDILIVTSPPRHGKSTYLAHWAPVHYIQMDPQRVVLLMSYGATLAKHHNRRARDRYHQLAPLFGNKGVSATNASAADWETAEGGGMMSSGLQGSYTGRGASLILIDDYLRSSRDAASPTVRENQWETFRATISTRREPGCKIIILATPWHKEDLIGMVKSHAEELDLKVRMVQLQAIKEGSTPDPMHRSEGEALWPSRWPAATLEKQRRLMGKYWWNAQYQGAPGLYGDSEWDEALFSNIWAQEDEWPERCILSAVALDPSKAKSRKSDYQALVYTGYKDGIIWIEADVDRRPVTRMMSNMARFCKERQPAIVGIEANAFQDLLAPDYVAACEDIGYNITDPELIQNNVSKDLRIMRLSTYIENRQFRIKRNAGGERLLEQLKGYPNAEHDDGPDALEMSLRLLAKLTGAQHGDYVTETRV